MVRPSTKSRRAFKRAHPRSPSVDDIDDDDDDDDDVSPSHSYPRARSEEPPFPIRDPHGVTPVDKYGTLVAQQVREWKKKRQKEKLKKYLEGQYSFTDSDEDDEGELKSEGTEVEVEEKPPDKEVSSASSAAHAAVQTVPAVVLVTVPKRYTQVSDDDDDDIPCAPAIPLTQKGVSSGSSAKKASEPTGNKAQPPSTAPSLVPIVQVKETPYRRASGLVNPPINSKAQLFEVHNTNVEEMVPATNEQQSSSIENKDEELERQSASFIRMQSGLNVMQESSGCIDDQIEKAHKEVSAVEVPGTQAEYKPNDSAKPHVTLQKWRAKMLKSADFASQEIRDAQDDISTRIEEEHRKFLAAQALGGMSLAAKQISINTEIRLRGAAQPSSSIHGKKPTTTSAPSSSRKRPLALLSTPIATKKARVSSPHSTPRSATARSLASILATSPGLPSSPPSRPQLFNSRPKPAHTSSPPLRSRLSSGRPSLTLTSAPLYAPKPHGVSGLPPPSIAKLKPPDRPKPRGPPPPPLLPKDVKIIPMDYDSDSESGSNIIGPYKLISPQQHPPGVLYAPKPKCKATPEEEERKSQEQQPAQPQTELYAGFRPRSIAVPGYEKLSDNQRRELDERRRRFFGTHREVEKFIGTPWTSDRGEAVTAQRKSRWSGDGDLWWMEDDTPMRRFVTRFKGLKTVRKELGEDV